MPIVKQRVTAILFALVLGFGAGTAAGSTALEAEIFRRHFEKLEAHYKVHLFNLMHDAAKAVAVIDRLGLIEEEPVSSKPAAPGGEPGDAGKPAGPEALTEADLQQLYTAARELRSVAAALQRAPIPPGGHWIEVSQNLKAPAVKMVPLVLRGSVDRTRYFVAKAMDACYECHRVYGGPLDLAGLKGQATDRYEQPYALPGTPGRD